MESWNVFILASVDYPRCVYILVEILLKFEINSIKMDWNKFIVIVWKEDGIITDNISMGDLGEQEPVVEVHILSIAAVSKIEGP